MRELQFTKIINKKLTSSRWLSLQEKLLLCGNFSAAEVKTYNEKQTWRQDKIMEKG